MLTCYAEKRACYSLISYKTKKTQSCTDRSGTKIRTVRVRQDSCIYIVSNLFLIEARDGARHPVDVGSAPTGAERRPRTVRVRRSPSLRETGCWKSIGLPLAPTEVERRYEPFESGRTRLYTKGILLGYLLYIRRARDGTRTRDPDLGKVVLHQLSHSRIINKIFISKAGDGNRTHVFSLEG